MSSRSPWGPPVVSHSVVGSSLNSFGSSTSYGRTESSSYASSASGTSPRRPVEHFRDPHSGSVETKLRTGRSGKDVLVINWDSSRTGSTR